MDVFELWAPVTGYDEPYRASTLGRVQDARCSLIMPTARSSVTGNTYVRLRRQGSDIWSRLDCTVIVAHTGLGPGICDLVHRDGDLQNNRLSNLEWRQAQRQEGGEGGTALSNHDLYDLRLAGWTARGIARFFDFKEDAVQSALDKYLELEQTPELSGAETTIDEDDLPF